MKSPETSFSQLETQVIEDQDKDTTALPLQYEIFPISAMTLLLNWKSPDRSTALKPWHTFNAFTALLEMADFALHEESDVTVLLLRMSNCFRELFPHNIDQQRFLRMMNGLLRSETDDMRKVLRSPSSEAINDDVLHCHQQRLKHLYQIKTTFEMCLHALISHQALSTRFTESDDLETVAY